MESTKAKLLYSAGGVVINEARHDGQTFIQLANSTGSIELLVDDLEQVTEVLAGPVSSYYLSGAKDAAAAAVAGWTGAF